MFANKTLLITGGTGSFGNAVLNRFLDTEIAEIRIFSRDEKKQDDMRKKLNNPKVKFYIGDVRDFSSVQNVMEGVNYVFHAAALKQVPSCEFFPMEAYKTNVVGTENVLNSAITNNVEKVVCLSTDKAVYPINAMGISKAMMEKVMMAKSRTSGSTEICCTRYGNVIASRGSVVPLFIDQIKSGKKITITDPDMTRFMMTLDDAVNLVLFAFKENSSGEIYVQKSPAASMFDLAEALKCMFKRDATEIEVIGTRHGEKLYESLMTKEELSLAIDHQEYFSVPPDLRDLNYSNYIEKGKISTAASEDYNSHNTKRLNIDEIISLLKKVDYINDQL